MTNEIEGLDIWRHHARKAEAAARNACNCRLLLTAWSSHPKHATKPLAICDALRVDATRYSLEAQQHAAIARTFRDGFQPITSSTRRQLVGARA